MVTIIKIHRSGIITMAGNKGEFDPTQILEGPVTPGVTAPHIKFDADLRSDGCPYFRFEYFLGSNSADDFWRNALAGAPWENVPLVYNAPSGNALNRLVFETERKTSLSDLIATNPGAGVPVKAASGVETGFGEKLIGGALAVADVFKGGIKGTVGNAIKYINDSTRQTLNFGVSQVRTPDITFPYNSNIMRDALGNGVIVYRYRYSRWGLRIYN